MNIPVDLIIPGILVLLVVFAAGAGSGTFLGKLWTKAKAFDAAESTKLKAELAKMGAVLKPIEADVKAVGEIGWDEVAKVVAAWKAELEAAVAARVKADQAAAVAAAVLAASKSQPIAANLAPPSTPLLP